MLAPTTHASARARPVRCLLAAALLGLAWLLRGARLISVVGKAAGRRAPR
jgi:hypothetical protein